MARKKRKNRSTKIGAYPIIFIFRLKDAYKLQARAPCQCQDDLIQRFFCKDGLTTTI